MWLLFGGGWVYLANGSLPVAVANQGLPLEQQLVDVPLYATIGRENQIAPFIRVKPASPQSPGARICNGLCSPDTSAVASKISVTGIPHRHPQPPNTRLPTALPGSIVMSASNAYRKNTGGRPTRAGIT